MSHKFKWQTKEIRKTTNLLQRKNKMRNKLTNIQTDKYVFFFFLFEILASDSGQKICTKKTFNSINNWKMSASCAPTVH